MNEEFIAALRAQVVDAADRDERRGSAARAARVVVSAPPWRIAGSAVALAAAAIALVVGFAGSRTSPAVTGGPTVTARVALAGTLGDSAQVGFGSIWLDDTQGRQVLRVDPASRRIIARIPVPGDVTMAAAGDALWLAPRSSDLEGFGFSGPLLRVDPHDNRVTDRVALKTPAGARFIGSELLADPADPAILWIAGGDGVLGFDTRVLRVTQAILPGRGPTYIDSFGASASGLWIATDDAHLLRYDRGSHARRAVVRLPHDLTGLAGFVILGADANGVILDTGSEVSRVSARTGKQAWRTPSLTDIRAAAVAQGKVWIVASDTTHPRDRLLSLDALSGRLLTSTTVPDFSAVAILPTGSALWLPTAGGTVDIVAGALR